FHRTAPPHLSPLSLHDALPILTSCWIATSDLLIVCAMLLISTRVSSRQIRTLDLRVGITRLAQHDRAGSSPAQQRMCSGLSVWRSEEHTSELQSRVDLVCRLLL